MTTGVLRSPLPVARGGILLWILLDLAIIAATAVSPVVLGVFLGLCAYSALERRPQIALAFVAVGLPILDWVRLAGGPNASGIPIEAMLLVPPVLAIAWMQLARAGADAEGPGILGSTLRDPLVLFSLAFGALLCLGLLWTPAFDYGRSKTVLFALVCVPVLVAARVLLGRARSQTERVETGFQFLRAIVLFEAVIAISGLVNLIFEIYPYGTRLNVLALNVVWLSRHMGIALLCTLLLLAARRLRRGVGIPLALLFAYVFYLAGSRGPLVALLATLTVWALVQQRASAARSIAIGVLVAGALGGLLFWIEKVPTLASTPFGGHDISNLARLFLLQGAVANVGSTGWFGPGTGSFPALLGFGDARIYPHNLFLEVLVENGIVGASVLGLIVVLTVRRWRGAHLSLAREGAAAAPQAWLVRTAGLAWLYSMLNAQFSGDIPQNPWLWLWTGVLAAWAERR